MMDSTKLLINEPPLQVLPSLAKKIGLNEAILIQQIHYWLSRSNHQHDARKWFYKSAAEWADELGFWSDSTIRRTLANLLEMRLISVRQLHKVLLNEPYNRTKWYSINYDQLEQLNSANASGQNDKLGTGQNDQIPCGQNDQMFQENTTENTTEINTPLTPKGKDDVSILTNAKKALEYYNELTHTRCEDPRPFETLLTPTKSRNAYTLEDLQLVTYWVINTWKSRNGRYAKPANICRVTRFDGYLADARAWSISAGIIDCDSVIAVFNGVFDDVLPPAELDPDRKRTICELLQYLKTKDLDAFQSYFETFRDKAPEFYFGGASGEGWRANFDYLMKPEVLRKTRDGAL
ncbi:MULTISPECIES: hypothetical protein [Yersinia pseudotuberculosis complex]|nr:MULTISPECIES: hypothetical protein [Yersinia pseudotuberculosis complex]MCE4113751.1 hypothetical protein [Yersinia pseudotuberculosis]MCF1165059.1 hypothetical protein [Yersinia pseudotuberculosis]UFA61925.1 Uncharacterized protein YP598_2307 [Yersinia pseudotuberculosis]WLF02223.1 hypothetical protein Q6G25_11135 [Yersinia pseudotuberculosis]CNB09291.1 Uncharacterised protein [Yersinia similis]